MDRRQFIKGVAGAGALGLVPRMAMAEEDVYYAGFRKGLAKHPWLGAFTGASTELDAAPVKFEGKLPRELRGVLYRNGPGLIERGGQRYQHLFDGDGMVQAYAIGDNGLTHRGRFVRTRKFIAETEAGKFLFPGFGTSVKSKFPLGVPDSVNVANTNVVAHGGRLMALWEAGSAYELDPATLDTRGPVTWAKDYKGMPFSAHPKIEPDGTMWNFGAFAGVLALYHIGADGKLIKADAIKVPGLAMNHDFLVSSRHLIFVLPPMRVNLEKVREGVSLLDSMDFFKNEPMRVLTIEKSDFAKQRTYELPPGFLFHCGNGWEDKDGMIRFDYVRQDAGAGFLTGPMRALMRGDVSALTPAHSRSTQVVIDTARGAIREQMQNENVEFPRIDPRFVGVRNRHLFHVANTGKNHNTFAMNTVLRFDLDTGKTDQFRFGGEVCLEEHIVVPRPGRSGEGDGWLIGCGFNATTSRTEVFVFDALNVAAGPIAIARLPYAVPLGFHGDFLPV